MIRARSATKVLAMIYQQPQLALHTVETGDRQIRLAHHRPNHCQGIDGIRLTVRCAPSHGYGPSA